MSVLLLDKVNKRFGGLSAVSDVSLTVHGGQVTGLIGPNGAGKTTIVNLITGIFSLTSGVIMLDDVEIGRASAAEVARMGVSRTFQNIRLLAEASVLDNVMIGFHRHERASIFSGLFGLRPALRELKEFRTRGCELLEQFQLDRFRDHPAGSLAYGHQRRLEIARAVATDPTILLLDEPVAGMNDVEAADLARIFRTLACRGMGLLLIEHNIRFVTKLCDHVHVLDSGKLIASAAPEEVTRHPSVIAAYLGAA